MDCAADRYSTNNLGPTMKPPKTTPSTKYVIIFEKRLSSSSSKFE